MTILQSILLNTIGYDLLCEHKNVKKITFDIL